MDTIPEQIQRILNEEFLTLIVKIDGTYLIGMFSQLERDKHIKENYNEVSWSAITFENETISLFYKDDYRISAISATNKDKSNQLTFWIDNNNLYNSTASLIANELDNTNVNCIIGNCAFVFDHNTNFTKEKLDILIEKYKCA